MQATECQREADVLEAVVSGLWTDELRVHADGCPDCGDLATVATLLARRRAEAASEAHLPTPGQVWWRATVRSRAEGAVAAARPITVVQGLAGACAAGLFAALLTLFWPVIQQPLIGIETALSRGGDRIGAAALSFATMFSLGIVLGAALILASFVLYFVLSDD